MLARDIRYTPREEFIDPPEARHAHAACRMSYWSPRSRVCVSQLGILRRLIAAERQIAVARRGATLEEIYAERSPQSEFV